MTKRYYRYVDIDENGDYIENIISDVRILEVYWDFWVEQMKKANVDPKMIHEEACIEDFQVVHWAYHVYDYSDKYNNEA